MMRILEGCDPKIAKDVQTILDTFSGADTSFLDLLSALRFLDYLKKLGAEGAQEGLDNLHRFAKMIRVATAVLEEDRAKTKGTE